MKRLFSTLSTCCLMLAALLLSGCIHEFPELEGLEDTEKDGGITPRMETRLEVNLNITHDYSWGSSDFDISFATRSADDGWRSRYVVKAFPAGRHDVAVYGDEFLYEGTTPEEICIPVMLPIGEWDVYVWKDNMSEDSGFHNVADFSAINYSGQYAGAHEMRDIFEGFARVEVEEEGSLEFEVPMCRPQSKYVFVATNFRQFFEEVLLDSEASEEFRGKSWSDLSGGQKERLLSGYSIVGIYPLFMPSAYNMYSKKIIDSARGVTFESPITPVDDDTAILAFDHVFIGESDNAVQVQIALRVPDGTLYQLTSTLTVPLRRGEITYAKGDILRVPQGSGGVEIDMDFSGEFNIHI